MVSSKENVGTKNNSNNGLYKGGINFSNEFSSMFGFFSFSYKKDSELNLLVSKGKA